MWFNKFEACKLQPPKPISIIWTYLHDNVCYSHGPTNFSLMGIAWVIWFLLLYFLLFYYKLIIYYSTFITLLSSNYSLLISFLHVLYCVFIFKCTNKNYFIFFNLNFKIEILLINTYLKCHIRYGGCNQHIFQENQKSEISLKRQEVLIKTKNILRKITVTNGA